MEQSDLQNLLIKYNNGTCSPEESAIVENWYLQWNIQPQVVDETELSAVKDDVWQSVSEEITTIKTVRLWKRMGIAAAITLFTLSIGIWLYQSNFSDRAQTIRYGSDVDPGGRGATLTLANGKKIKLDTAHIGLVDELSGFRISKAEDGKLVYEYTGAANSAEEIHTLSTEKGETYQILLPDGSLVWLNAATSLSFSTGLNSGSIRKVTLSGEGYFEVAEDKSRPFIVESEGQEVEVLGTHFNVNAYSDEASIKTTLIEGSVRIRKFGNFKNQIVLKPNQQATTTDAGISVKRIDVVDVVDWKNEGFIFNGGNFDVSMRKIARWYDVQIIYDSATLKDSEIGGFISRKNSLSAVLKFIESTGKVHFKIEGRRVFVTN